MAAKNSVRIIHFCKSIVEEKSYAHSVWSRSHHPPCDPKPYHKGVCICLSFPTQVSPLQIIKWHLKASCSRATKAHSSLFMCSFEDLRVKTYKVLHIHTHQKLKKKRGHTARLAKTFEPQLQEKHTCPPKVTKLFLCTVSCLGKRFQEARVHLRMCLSLAGLDMTTMYRWRNFDFQRHWKAILLSCPTC